MFKNKGSAMKSVSNLMSNLQVQAKDLQTKASAKYTGYVQPSHVTHDMLCVNGAPLSPEALDILKGQKNGLRVLRLLEGAYWYDPRSGWFGREGHGPRTVLDAGLALGEGKLQEQCSDGQSEFLLNGRRVGRKEAKTLKLLGMPLTDLGGSLWMDRNGSFGAVGDDKVVGNFWKLAKRNAAVALLVAALFVITVDQLSGLADSSGDAGGGSSGGAADTGSSSGGGTSSSTYTSGAACVTSFENANYAAGGSGNLGLYN
ncbi:hypothetical protein WJX72_011335 [[Myrmecia] bisecta]|uniref:Uncharacterized protein n=1 Tax=[Myrmecia] bisecta TaxID=41462 RepID=A0AAW1Q2A7_9CHLO